VILGCFLSWLAKKFLSMKRLSFNHFKLDFAASLIRRKSEEMSVPTSYKGFVGHFYHYQKLSNKTGKPQ